MSHLSKDNLERSGNQFAKITMCGFGNSLEPPSYFPENTSPSLIDSTEAYEKAPSDCRDRFRITRLGGRFDLTTWWTRSLPAAEVKKSTESKLSMMYRHSSVFPHPPSLSEYQITFLGSGRPPSSARRVRCQSYSSPSPMIPRSSRGASNPLTQTRPLRVSGFVQYCTDRVTSRDRSTCIRRLYCLTVEKEIGFR